MTGHAWRYTPDMKIVKKQRFNARVTALELGYGIIGRPVMNVYCYLIGDTLIDCGQTKMAGEMKSFVLAHRIKQLLLTHHHEDHSGNAAMIANECGAAVMGHPITAHKMGHIPTHLTLSTSRMGTIQGSRRISSARGGGVRWVSLSARSYPGTQQGSYCIFGSTNGWLFSGDLYLGDRIKFFRSDEKIDQQIQSLQIVLQHDFEALFCAHNPVLKNGRDRLRRKLAYLEDIVGAVDLLLTRGMPEREIIRQLDHRQDRFVKFFTMGNVSFANMIRSAIRAI
jgi:glyoxylase-like metal-dependent hydrolase (beta-lactamase superfamily II)